MIARAFTSAVLNRLREGRLDVIDGSEHRSFGPPGAELSATVRLHDSRFWRALPRGSLGLAEAYSRGSWDCDDLVALVRMGAREMPRIDAWRRPFVPALGLLSRVPRNTRRAARRHIAAHYDLGNDLFGLFLDETMTYSCALFGSPEPGTLRDAQQRKLDVVCRKLELGPSDHLLEIGTGWGSFALHAAEHYGCRVTTATISEEQHAVARGRVREAGLEDRVEVVLSDYRDLRGSYDKLVSIEMIEAVGWQYFDDYFARCAGLVDSEGLMLLQAIVIDDRAYSVEKASRSFMNELIFPSGCLPSVDVISRSVARATDMRVLDIEDMTDHYSETLRRWRAAFREAETRAEAMGYDEPFRRLWDLYFAYCEGGFTERRIGVLQAALAKPGHRGFARREPAAVAAGS